MSVMTATTPVQRRVSDLEAALAAEETNGLAGIPHGRIFLDPWPGTATYADLLAFPQRSGPVELVHGTLVEKAMGFEQSTLASRLIQAILNWMDDAGRGGIVADGDGGYRFLPDTVRKPDVSYISWARLRPHHGEAYPAVAPELAVEVLSPGNTEEEMAAKVALYFASGVLLVWVADWRTRTVRVYTSATESVLLTDADILGGGTLLPGFALRIRAWFDSVQPPPE